MKAESPGNPIAAKNAKPVSAAYTGILARQSAEGVDFAGVCAVVDHPDQDEKHRRDGAVVEHLQHRAVDPGLRERAIPSIT